MEELLTIENVSKSFPLNDGNLLQVLSDVNLKILNIPVKPQILSILGPSGGGKTTLLRILAGLDVPDSGRVVIKDGKNGGLRQVTVGDIGVVFQRYPLFDDRTVLQNLVEPAVNGGLKSGEARAKAVEYLKEFDLSRQANSYPVQLSGGQRQRVAIAQQLIQERRYIILDEPFSGLDPNNIANVIHLLQEIAEQHDDNTFIIVTHDITSAMIISDHIHLLGKPNDTDEKSGAYFVKNYDLIEEGLAYQPNIEDLSRFQAIRKEIKYVHFPRLVIAKN
jgi:NitT/TauT family transport system ATP-binding protein